MIKKFADERGFVVGVCNANPISWSVPPESTNGAPFIRYTYEQRTVPGNLLKGARSIFVVGMGCNREEHFENDGLPRGRLSLNAVGVDYHIMVRKILDELEELLRKHGYVFDCFKSVDTGPLSEKTLAVKAGLGWIGKHGLVISEQFGSFFNIGYMITTLALDSRLWDLLPSDKVSYQRGARCGQCNVCVRSCPGDALIEVVGSGVFFDYKRCVSYLTQKKGELTDDEKRVMGTRLYGCDDCQKVCIYNQNTYVGRITDIDYVMPPLDDIDRMTKVEFAERYRSTAIFWRGLGVYKRNAANARENFRRK